MESKNDNRKTDRDMLVMLVKMAVVDNTGLKYRDVADIMNEAGYKTEKGCKFTCQNIRSYILAEEL